MALQTIPGGLWIPKPPPLAALLHSNYALAASGRVAQIFQVPRTGTLDKVEFRTGTVTSPTDIRISFQDVSTTTGDPDGTQDQFRDVAAGSLASNSWIVPGLMTSTGADGGVKRSVTRGQFLSVVIEYVSGAATTFEVSGLNNSGNGQAFAHYSDLFTGSWAKSQARQLSIALKYDDGSYEFLGSEIMPISAFNTHNFGSGSSPNERGINFQLPVPFSVGGAWVYIDLDGDAELTLYDAAGSVNDAVTLDANMRAANGQGGYFLRFDGDFDYAANTSARLALKPTTATTINAYSLSVGAADILGGFEGGPNWHTTFRTGAGAWDDTTTTQRMWMGLLVTRLDDGVSSGAGLMVHPGMTGGMRG